EAGVRPHQGTAGLEKGPARAIDPLVCPGCHQQAVRRDADPGGEGGFEGGDVRVTAQQLRVCVGEIAEQGARWQDTLIRVEAKHAGTARRTPVGGGRVDPRHRTGRRSGGRGRHGTICEKVETTRSVPPAAFTAGITCGNASRGTAAFTAYPPFPNSGATVACRIDGSTATTASRHSAEAFTSSITRRRATSTDSSSITRSSIRRRRARSSSASGLA